MDVWHVPWFSLGDYLDQRVHRGGSFRQEDHHLHGVRDVDLHISESSYVGEEFVNGGSWILPIGDHSVHHAFELEKSGGNPWDAVSFFQLTPEFTGVIDIIELISYGMVEAESHVSKRLLSLLQPVVVCLLVYDVFISIFVDFYDVVPGHSTSFGLLPLPLGHQERLHRGGPLLIVGAVEGWDEGGELGRHLRSSGRVSNVLLNII
jgi:hypothetical protein